MTIQQSNTEIKSFIFSLYNTDVQSFFHLHPIQHPSSQRRKCVPSSISSSISLPPVSQSSSAAQKQPRSNATKHLVQHLLRGQMGHTHNSLTYLQGERCLPVCECRCQDKVYRPAAHRSSGTTIPCTWARETERFTSGDMRTHGT
jgi:hypothetical protein